MLTSRQQRIVLQMPWWVVARIIIDPDEGIQHAVQSGAAGSGLVVDGEPYWWSTDRDGWHVYRARRGNVLDVVRWRDLREHVHSLPAQLRADVLAAMKDHTAAQVGYRQFRAHGPEIGCGRPAYMAPQTFAQWRYEVRLDAWHRHVEVPQQARIKAAEARVRELVAAAFPASSGEAVDLFDFLTL